jgi:hypothetical protein
MRTEIRTEEKMVVTTVTKYIANDGKEFDSQDECERYEYSEYINGFEALPKVEFDLNQIVDESGYSNDIYSVIPIRNEKDVEIINGYLMYCGDEGDITEDDIGTTVMFITNDNKKTSSLKHYPFEEMRGDIIKALDEISGEIEALKKNI